MGWKWTEAELAAYMATINGKKATPSISRLNKYGAKRVMVDGYAFDSKAEAQRYSELKLIDPDLIVHQKFPILINKIKVCDVEMDFSYIMNGKVHHEDVKGHDTALSKLKRKMVEAQYGITVELIRC